MSTVWETADQSYSRTSLTAHSHHNYKYIKKLMQIKRTGLNNT